MKQPFSYYKQNPTWCDADLFRTEQNIYEELNSPLQTKELISDTLIKDYIFG